MSVNDDTTPPTTDSSAPLDVSTPAPTAAANVPNLMMIGAMPINTQMNVETDILETVVFSETFCRFRLQNKGILHSNSKIVFALDTSSGSGADCILPANIGIHSIIDRAVLKVGTKTICETDGFNHFMQHRSSFVNPQHNKQRESITSSRLMCRKWEYNLGVNAKSASGRTDSINEANDYTLDLGIDVNALNNASASRDIAVHKYTLLNPTASAANGTGTSDFQITINDLFPFLKMNQLPLYMMKEEIDIELYFAKENKRGVSKGGVVASDKFAAKLIRNSTQMIADYIYYPQEIMTAYQNANNNMSFTYVDYRLVKHTVDNSADESQSIILNVGGAGRVVNKLFFGLSRADTTAIPQRSGLFNLYSSYGSGEDSADNLGAVSHNVRYNDKFLYPIDIKNNARLFHNMQQAEGSVPFISKDEYVGELGLISERKVFGYQAYDSLETTNFWVEDRLNRNERVNSRGIEIYQTWGALEGGLVYTMRCWLEIVKYATLQDGILQTYYA